MLLSTVSVLKCSNRGKGYFGMGKKKETKIEVDLEKAKFYKEGYLKGHVDGSEAGYQKGYEIGWSDSFIKCNK